MKLICPYCSETYNVFKVDIDDYDRIGWMKCTHCDNKIYKDSSKNPKTPTVNKSDLRKNNIKNDNVSVILGVLGLIIGFIGIIMLFTSNNAIGEIRSLLIVIIGVLFFIGAAIVGAINSINNKKQ